MDLENLTTEEQIYADAMEGAGVPITADAINSELQTLADDAHLEIANSNKYSAFWNFCANAITSPALWLIAYMIRNIIPNLYVKTATGGWLDILAWSYGLTRKAAVKATGDLTFSRDNTTQALLIPAGTRVRTIPINGNIYRMVTLADATMEVGVGELAVACEAETAGTAWNLGTAYYSIMDSDVPGITAVTNKVDWLSAPGADEEPDADLRLRMRNQFSAVADWHTDAKYTAMIAERTGYSVDRIFFDHSFPRGPACGDAYILFDAATVPDEYLTDINDYITDENNHGHGDFLIVYALPETNHDVTVSVTFASTTTAERITELLVDIENFIRCAFRENSDYAEFVTQTTAFATLRFSRLDQELHNYFPEITGMVWGTADIVANLEVARLGVLTVN